MGGSRSGILGVARQAFVTSIVFHGEARAELDEAMAFYENRSKGLGLDQQASVREAVLQNQAQPGKLAAS